MSGFALPHISATVLGDVPPPTVRIHTDADVGTWQHSAGYHMYGTFLRRLNESVIGWELPLQDNATDSEAITRTLRMLVELTAWVDDIPPYPTAQRFGNLAFREYGKRLVERSEAILQALLPSELHVAIPLIRPYFLISFGSFQRIDYGTGHETSFALFLLCLTLLRFFTPEPDEERRLVLRIFERYLGLVWKLQDVYRLEPAGSHGVWGLDDFGFLGYLFGSGQLRDRHDLSPAMILNSSLPNTDLYSLSIMRIHQLKHGPFHEHSPQLYSIAQGVARWSKVNSGMFKMYEAEVLRKRVVVQHIPLGGLLAWNDHSARERTTETGAGDGTATGTTAPWTHSDSRFNATRTQGSYGQMPPPLPTSMPRR